MVKDMREEDLQRDVQERNGNGGGSGDGQGGESIPGIRGMRGGPSTAKAGTLR